MAEQWEGTGNWGAAQWLVHCVESVDIGSGFDAANPLPTFASILQQTLAMAWALARQQLPRLPRRRSRLPGLGARFGDEYPHFPNGRRRLGLSPQVLVECQSWIVEARDSRNYLGFTSGDWLVHWFAERIAERRCRLVQCASEGNEGWSAASWLKLWLGSRYSRPSFVAACWSGSPGRGLFRTWHWSWHWP